MPLLVLAACPVENRPAGAPRLSGNIGIKVKRGSAAFRVYHSSRIEEAFACSYELNPDYRETLEDAGLKVTGVGDGGTRIVELPGRRFFVGTGFLPQLSSEPGCPHPLIVAFLQAALDNRTAVKD